MIPICVDMLGLDAEKQAHQITSAERNRLVYWMKDFRFRVTGLGGFAEAIVTAGGISTREIDPRTLASRVVPGLYLAGEIMDLDANTGGYNLQIAFSTGWVAGQEAARKMIVRDKD